VRVLILGGTGQTGPYAVRRLAALGHEVTVFHRGQHGAELPDGVRVLHGSIADPPKMLRQFEPDVVVHMWAMNAAHAAAFLGVFRGFAGRAIVISSGDVYRAYGKLQGLEQGDPDPIPLTEDAPLRQSRYPYRGKPAPMEDVDQYDKILVEEALLAQSEMPATILRYPAVYGPLDYHRMGRWVQEMERSPEIRLQADYGRWRWTHGYVEDVAESVVLAATHPGAARRIYNVGEAETPTFLDRIEELGRAAAWPGRIVPTPAEELPDSERLPLDFRHHLAYDTTRIRTELRYQKVVLREEALARTIAWERQTGAVK
jgi:nucleoside-diphosphate-sugar epimerase